MNKTELQEILEYIRESRGAVLEAHRDINEQARRVMKRLLFEAAHNRMSVVEVAQHSGYSKARLRQMMRQFGLDPKWNKSLLGEHAAQALAENADLLEIDPKDLDLTSPLAYLPAGEQLRNAVDRTRSREVTGVPWSIEEVRDGEDMVYEVYEGEDFIATFYGKAEAERVIALVNA